MGCFFAKFDGIFRLWYAESDDRNAIYRGENSMENKNYKQSKTMVLILLPLAILYMILLSDIFFDSNIYSFMMTLSFIPAIFDLLMPFVILELAWFWLILSIIAFVSAHRAKKEGCEKIDWVYRLAIVEMICFSLMLIIMIIPFWFVQH